MTLSKSSELSVSDPRFKRNALFQCSCSQDAHSSLWWISLVIIGDQLTAMSLCWRLIRQIQALLTMGKPTLGTKWSSICASSEIGHTLPPSPYFLEADPPPPADLASHDSHGLLSPGHQDNRCILTHHWLDTVGQDYWAPLQVYSLCLLLLPSLWSLGLMPGRKTIQNFV